MTERTREEAIEYINMMLERISIYTGQTKEEILIELLEEKYQVADAVLTSIEKSIRERGEQ